MVPRALVGEPYVTNFVTKGVFDLLLRMSQENANEHVVEYLDFLASPTCIYVIMEPLLGDDLFEALLAIKVPSEAFMRETDAGEARFDTPAFVVA